MFQQTTINYDELKIGNELGRGAFGIVYQGTYRFNNVAIKQLLLVQPSVNALQEFKQEMELMADLHCPQIIQLYGIYLEPSYGIVMEYMPNGSLHQMLHSNKPLDWLLRSSIALDISKGVAFLHKENILHRDLKSLNVLLDKYMNAKLADFGLSKVKSETNSITSPSNNTSVAGTLLWMAPELFERKATCTRESDVYSLGITLWELASRKMPFEEERKVKPPAVFEALVKKWISEGEREEIPRDCPKILEKLIVSCWDFLALKRPTADEIVKQLITLNQVVKEEKSATPFPTSFIIKYNELQIDNKPVGIGFCFVYHGVYRYNEVAVKKLPSNNFSKEAGKNLQKEMAILTKLRCPQIVRFYGCYLEPSYGIVMEYMSNGSLYQLLHSNKLLDWPLRYSIALDMSKGIAFLHKENILHKDLKSPNVLLDKHMNAKLADFGLSEIDETTGSSSAIVGTPFWMAPELLVGKTNTKASDIYSLGITLWELASRELPFKKDAANPSIALQRVQQGNREEIPKDCPPKIGKLITWCWDNEASKRPTADEVVKQLLAEEAKSEEKSFTFSYKGNFDSIK